MFFFYTRATNRLLGTAGGPKKTRISLVPKFRRLPIPRFLRTGNNFIIFYKK